MLEQNMSISVQQIAVIRVAVHLVGIPQTCLMQRHSRWRVAGRGLGLSKPLLRARRSRCRASDFDQNISSLLALIGLA